MANNQGPSKGCQRCRKLKMKCSQDRPTCWRCQKSGHDCLYQDTFDRLHRDQNTLVKSNATKKWRQRAALRPETPQHGVGFSIYDQAYRRFCYDFVAPLQGTLTRLPEVMSMVSPDSCISSAVAAVAYANFSARYKSRVANELSSVCYCITLRKLATLMTNPVEMQQKGVLLVIYLLALYETLTSAIRDGSWVTHMEGAQSILAHRESINCKEGDKYLSVLCTHLIVYYLKESKTPPLHFDSWLQSIPFHSPHNKQLVFLMLRTAEASIMLKEESATDRLIIPKLLDSALSLDFQLEKWASDVPLEWSYMARHPISHHGHPKLARELLDLPYAPRYMLLHSGILAAADWNMYRATRIRLNLAILEFLYKVPSNDLESQNLKCHITDLLSTLTHEIAYAIPYSLSLPADGTSDSQSAEGIPGLEAYVQLWPVLTGYICSRHRLVEGSGCVQTADWFKAILCFMRDSVGLAKVHLLLEEAAPS